MLFKSVKITMLFIKYIQRQYTAHGNWSYMEFSGLDEVVQNTINRPPKGQNSHNSLINNWKYICDLSFGSDQCQMKSSEGKGSPLLLSPATKQLWTRTLPAVMNQEVFAASLGQDECINCSEIRDYTQEVIFNLCSKVEEDIMVTDW